MGVLVGIPIGPFFGDKFGRLRRRERYCVVPYEYKGPIAPKKLAVVK